jgi:uncharacterized protein (UPF0276 family)
MASMDSNIPALGVGLGLRRAHFNALLGHPPRELEWFEIAPENYMEIGGWVYRDFLKLTEIRPVITHSVSLSLGSIDPLNRTFLKQLKKFIRDHGIPMASDHICFSSFNQVQFDDLLPLPFTEEAVKHISKRIKQVQEILEVPFAAENISYYAPSGAPEMSEPDFIRAVIEESGAWLLLDVNNLYVNSVNHGFDPVEYIRKMPLDRIAYVHMAGHWKKKEGFLIDTHGEEVIFPVWKLFDTLASMTELRSVMIERDSNIPPVEELVVELNHVHEILEKHRRTKVSYVA